MVEIMTLKCQTVDRLMHVCVYPGFLSHDMWKLKQIQMNVSMITSVVSERATYSLYSAPLSAILDAALGHGEGYCALLIYMVSSVTWLIEIV